MLKKYMYVGILLGAILLTGCSVNGKSEGRAQVKEKATGDGTNGRVIEVETLPDTDKKAVVSVGPLELTQEQKEDYYNQYVSIVEEVNSENNKDLEIATFDEFLNKKEWWLEPKDFKQFVIDMATAEFTSKVFGGDPVDVE